MRRPRLPLPGVLHSALLECACACELSSAPRRAWLWGLLVDFCDWLDPQPHGRASVKRPTRCDQRLKSLESIACGGISVVLVKPKGGQSVALHACWDPLLALEYAAQVPGSWVEGVHLHVAEGCTCEGGQAAPWRPTA
jgi:hypothetical protein